jgi:hypothetical protein
MLFFATYRNALKVAAPPRKVDLRPVLTYPSWLQVLRQEIWPQINADERR